MLHCLQKQADDRPATGELLAQELVTLLPQTLETSAYRSRITGSEPTVIVRSDSHIAVSPNGTASSKRRSGAFWVAGVVATAGLAVSMALFGEISRRRVGGAADWHDGRLGYRCGTGSRGDARRPVGAR